MQDELVFKLEVETGGLSDHRPIALSITKPEENPLLLSGLIQIGYTMKSTGRRKIKIGNQ